MRARFCLILTFLLPYLFLNCCVKPSCTYRHSLHKHPPRLRSASHPYGFPRQLHLHFSPDFKPLQPSLPHLSRPHTVQLYGGMVVVGEYYAKILIGGQMLRTQIDTGSATLAVPMGECVRCRRGDRRYWVDKSNSSIAARIGCDDNRCKARTCHAFLGGCGKCSRRDACCAKESLPHCGFRLSFGDGSGASGCLVQDEMTWGGVNFPVVFGGILRDSKDFERNQVDGILGMAYPSLACNPTCVSPPLEAMAAHLKMKNLFQLCIAEKRGMLVLGEEDPSLAVEELKWVPLHLDTPPSYYTVKIAGTVKVGGEEVELSQLKRAIVDSGTTLIVLSSESFRKLANHFKSKYCQVPGLCGKKSWFTPAHCAVLHDDVRNLLPAIVIPLENGVNIELGPSEYMINYASKGKDLWCVGIMSLPAMSGGIDVILGNTVMKKYVTTFDRENHRVGFAKSRGDCISRPNGALPAALSGDPRGTGKEPKKGQTSSGSSAPFNTGGGNAKPKPKAKNTFCSLAQNCGECSHVNKCMWDTESKTCTIGDAKFLMCFRDIKEMMKNPILIVGLVVVGSILLLSIFVAVVRRAQRLHPSEEERELERPLADDEDGLMDESRKGDANAEQSAP